MMAPLGRQTEMVFRVGQMLDIGHVVMTYVPMEMESRKVE